MAVYRFKPLYLVIAGVVVGVSGCLLDSNGSGSSIDDPGKISTTVITNPEQGVGALSAGLSGADSGTRVGNNAAESAQTNLTSGFGKIMTGFNISTLNGSKNPKLNMSVKQLQEIMGHSNKQLKGALASNNTQDQCSEGVGSVTESGSGDENNYSLTVSYNNCRLAQVNDYYTIVNGTLKKTYSSTDTSKSLATIRGDGDINADSSDLVWKFYSADNTLLSSDTVSLKFNFESLMGATPAQTVSLHGRTVVENNVSGAKDDHIADRFIAKIARQSSLNEDVLLNGALQHTTQTLGTDQPTEPSSVEYFGFSDFHYTLMQSSTDASITEKTLDGKVVVDHTPEQCGDGAYNFTTSQAIQLQNGQLIAGTLMINDNTTVQINSDGSIDVDVDGQSKHFDSEDDLSSVCLVSSGS